MPWGNSETAEFLNRRWLILPMAGPSGVGNDFHAALMTPMGGADKIDARSANCFHNLATSSEEPQDHSGAFIAVVPFAGVDSDHIGAGLQPVDFDSQG